ncbi:tetratricopeptide repeat protein [Glycomyces buryatensis]|uniref:Tetratricopeptide repeat protein n=1 Tax=Glycomyces buryatensis TaxID=2570927 RepID=A0A4S8Q5Q3_9ACTN|nr:tetratricopeptide repeat protein [Glycomyces buryatensis]THV39420.1 tetratricopeptide repeat protein [Glycomyces buryatensis]
MAVIDDLAEQSGGMTDELFGQRISLMADGGRTDQAITELRGHPSVDTRCGTRLLAVMLEQAGRLDEAIAVLRPMHVDGANATDLARLLILQDRVGDAVTVLEDARERR